MAESVVQPEERARPIEWYRSPVESGELRRLYVRSDAMGFAQSLGYLGVLIVLGAAAYRSSYHWSWPPTVALVFVYGTCYAFMINAVHETGHDTVFRTKWLNVAFTHLFAFLGWINHRTFGASHVRHHRSTLHPPDDLEVVVPVKITLEDFLKFGFVNFGGLRYAFRFNLRIARGGYAGEWETKLFPADNPERRRWASQWSWTILIGHAAILVVAVCLRLWMIPVLVTLAPFYGGWLHFLCNSTQHVGLRDNVTDYRRNTRTVLLSPVVEFLYWHMNFHVEHHMYVGVPCYRLGRLHRLIAADLPPAPKGLLAAWREIGAILKRQAAEPGYQHDPLIGLSPVQTAEAT